MASVTSLDQDMRKLRLSRYTSSTANEARTWIEDTLGRTLPAGDLLQALKDGVALCELANLVLPAPGIKYKKSAMPFVQMENISHFLRACEASPLNLPAHDRFLTVDLYESKDPAQVLQCLGAFSRQAHTANPSRFPSTIGPKKAGVISPAGTGSGNASSWQTTGSARTQTSSSTIQSNTRAMSPSMTGDSTGSHTSTTRSPAPVSSWSKKSDQNTTAPAWNPVMYGYMGGADQAKQGVSFGARRQITSASPHVPSLAEKERLRKEKKIEQEEISRRERAEAERQEQLEKEAEEQKWEQETQRLRDEERIRLVEQKREWEAQEQRWKDEERRRQEEEVTLQPVKRPPEQPRTSSGNILRGQTLSQYQREQAQTQRRVESETPEQAKVRELEKQLAEARERERQYQAEREERTRADKDRVSISDSMVDRPQTGQSGRESELSWAGNEHDYLRKQWRDAQQSTPSRLSTTTTAAEVEEAQSRSPISTPGAPTRLLTKSAQPLQYEESPSDLHTRSQESVLDEETTPQLSTSSVPAEKERAPLLFARSEQPVTTRGPPAQQKPISMNRSPFARPANRTETYLSSNPAPASSAPRVSASAEAGDTAREQSALRDQRLQSQQKTQAGAWASKSLLEREMERERERQREWEAGQEAMKSAPRDTSQGSGPGQSWDVNTYGFTAGDSQNRGSSSGSGISMGGRRQIIGPRPQP